MILHLPFDIFYQKLVLVTTTLQNLLYQYLNSLELMNTLSKIFSILQRNFDQDPNLFVASSDIQSLLKYTLG